MNSQIKYPFAIGKETNKLVSVDEVKNGKKCNCYCYECNEDLIAVNNVTNKRAHHFRHDPKSICNANYETFIHWMAKEVLKGLKSIELPEIRFKTLNDDYVQVFQNFEKRITKLYDDYNVPVDLRHSYKYDFVIQESKILEFDNCLFEEPIRTKMGLIVVDVVLKKGNNYIFLEPFYSNPIDSFKYQKLVDHDNSTLSIDLRPFHFSNNNFFTIDEFKEYLISERSKSWVLIREKKVKGLINKFFQKLEKRLNIDMPIFKEFITIQKAIKSLNVEQEILIKAMSKLNNKEYSKEDELNKIKEDYSLRYK